MTVVLEQERLAVRKKAQAYFRNGGHRAENIAIALHQQHMALQWSEVVKIVIEARKEKAK